MTPVDHPSAPSNQLPASPWDDLDEQGAGLSVDHFLTTRLSQAINALRRTVTLPYAQEAGLTVSEWRLLSYVALSGSIRFPELVRVSTSDKALVSRTVKLLEQRALVTTEAHGNTPRKKITVVITEAGQALHDKVIRIARASQAEAIRTMTVEERRAVYSALDKLMAHCLSKGPIGVEPGTGTDG